MSDFTLYGARGAGSAATEMALNWVGADYTFEPCNPFDATDRTRLEAVNPVGQIPCLVTPEGHKITESVATIFALADRYPEAGLAPKDPVVREAFYRWCVFVTANLYTDHRLFNGGERYVGGDNAVGDVIKAHAKTRIIQWWRVLEMELSWSPFAFGAEPSGLDLLIGMVSHWPPSGPEVFADYPKLVAMRDALKTHPKVAKGFALNYGDA
ncbi:MAG: glutathione S-transferase family protein [Maricaulaceae bacterium]